MGTSTSKLTGQKREEVKPDLNALALALKEAYKNQNTLPPLFEDNESVAQEIDGYYVKLQITLQHGAKEASKKKPPADKSSRAEARAESRDVTAEIVPAEEDSKKAIEIPNLFQAREGIDSPKRILVQGKAGVGKTTLMHYIAYKWAKGELWTEKFDHVFRIRLRLLTSDWLGMYSAHFASGDDELSAFIHFCLPDRKISSVSDIVARLAKGKLLLLVDGYDEVVHLDTNDRSVVHRVMKQLFASEHHMLMTSRPNAVDLAFESRFDLQVENIGLDSAGVDQFVQSQFKSSGGDIELTNFLEVNPTLKDVCTIPVNAAMICLIWKSYPEFRDRLKADFILSDLYDLMMLWLGKRYLRKFKELDVTHTTIEEVFALPEFKILKELAFEGFRTGRLALNLDAGLIKGIAVKYSGVTIKQVHQFGLLRSESSLADDAVIDKRHEFIHLSFQEYLVALQVKDALLMEDESAHEAAEFIVTYRYYPRFLNVLRFLAGLVSTETGERGVQLEKIFWEALTCNIDGQVMVGTHEKIKLALQILPFCKMRSGVVFVNQQKLIDLVCTALKKDCAIWQPYFVEDGRYPSSVVETLITLLLATESSSVIPIVSVFATINVDAHAALIPILNHHRSEGHYVNTLACSVLGNIGKANPREVVPILFQLLKNDKTSRSASYIPNFMGTMTAS